MLAEALTVISAVNPSLIAKVADRQHGRITIEQLRRAGVNGDRITRWLAEGRLRRVHQGVYALGHLAPSTLGDYMAAVLAGGEAVCLSHAPAAYVCKIIRGTPPPPEITIPPHACRRRPGITIHRAALQRGDVFEVDGIPVTSIPRVLLDLAPRLASHELTRACHEAWVHHRTRPEHIEACIARSPRKPGIAKLRAALGAPVTLSELERAFVRLLAMHDLPRPRTNIDRSGDKVDCHWPDRDLTIELLSYGFHATRHAFETDVARRRRSRHIAYTWGDVTERAAQTAAEVAQLLSRPAARAA